MIASWQLDQRGARALPERVVDPFARLRAVAMSELPRSSAQGFRTSWGRSDTEFTWSRQRQKISPPRSTPFPAG